MKKIIFLTLFLFFTVIVNSTNLYRTKDLLYKQIQQKHNYSDTIKNIIIDNAIKFVDFKKQQWSNEINNTFVINIKDIDIEKNKCNFSISYLLGTGSFSNINPIAYIKYKDEYILIRSIEHKDIVLNKLKFHQINDSIINYEKNNYLKIGAGYSEYWIIKYKKFKVKKEEKFGDEVKESYKIYDLNHKRTVKGFFVSLWYVWILRRE